jgi:hypothetical protein
MGIALTLYYVAKLSYTALNCDPFRENPSQRATRKICHSS